MQRYMKKVDLNDVAEEFQMISNDMSLFYNKETGEFEFYGDFMDEEDPEKYDDGSWVFTPSQDEIREYDMMVDFAETVSDPRKNELLCVALEGRGAFRRFKDTLPRVGLEEQWYAFKHKAYVEVAREWCEENNLEYFDNAKSDESKPSQLSEHSNSKHTDSEKTEKTDLEEMLLIRVTPHAAPKVAIGAAEVIRETLGYSKTDADEEIRRIFSKKRIALAAIIDNRVVGIIGAIPQYGTTGWELHPLAVLKKYQGRGVGKALVEALEEWVADSGGVMIYLGSDDDTGTTSLFGEDLYDDTFGKLTNIQDAGGHPFPFYEKLGYKIVGVFPDANGIGKPDIWMAKRLTQ